MPNLADSLQCSNFLTKLRCAERNFESLDSWEQGFVQNMRRLFDSREDAQDLGFPEWNPSAAQINQLSEIERKCT